MYTFDNLSPFEFTELACDLIRVREQVELNISPEGPDQGIDIIRFGQGPTPELVVQCKHYKKSSRSQLLAHIKNELSKVQALNPQRYVLVVSQSLTPKIKCSLAEHFHPYLRSADDIIAAEDLNTLLRNYPDIERQHYKLWLNSATALHYLVNGTGVWNSHLGQEIEDRLRVYVQTPNFNEALRILEDNRIVIISGSPGIGKTTLAQMLVAKHLEAGFKYYEVESLDSEMRDIPLGGDVVLYFDDFLGRSVWRDNASQATEKRLEKLVDMVLRNSRMRLILTTRTYLLEGARRLSDFGSSRLQKIEGIELRLADFSLSTRARILYNHLYFHSVDSSYCKSLAGDGILQRILNHSNFVPRIIESISNSSNWPKTLRTEDYATHLLARLDSPDEIYLPAIQERISPNAKALLFVLLTRGERHPPIPALQIGIGLLLTESGLSELSKRDFESALKELAGSLVEIYTSSSGKDRCSFLNPGVVDSTRKALWSESDLWDKLARTSIHGEELYPLALCAPGVTAFPAERRDVVLPDSWFDQWIKIANNSKSDPNEVLSNLADCLGLNIWAKKAYILEYLVERIYARYQEGEFDQPEWHLLVSKDIRPEVINALSEVAWLNSSLDFSIRELLNAEGFTESYERYGSLKGLGNLGSNAYATMRAAAEDHIARQLMETHMTDSGEDCLFDDEVSDLRSLAFEFNLYDAMEILKTVKSEARVQLSRHPSIQAATVGRADLVRAEILAMFASLAQLPTSEFEKSLARPVPPL